MIEFRSANSKDIDSIVLLVNYAYRGKTSRAGWTTEADLLGGQRTDSLKIAEIIYDKNSRIELAIHGHELIGLIHIKKEEEFVYFGMLTVKPTLQNRGYGKKLLERLEEITLSWGLSKIRMTVIHLRHELIEYYQRRGYRWTGETEPFPSNDPRFGLPKTDLVFHVFEKIVNESQ